VSVPVELGLVSTVIPVHNRARLVREAVQSVLGQTYENTEIIIVDDGSTDETPVVLAELRALHPNKIRVLAQRNLGPGAAREAGRRLVQGEFVQYLDSDDLLLPTKFAAQVEALRSEPRASISYGKTRFYRVGDTPRGTAVRRTGERIAKLWPSILSERWWCTVTPLYRRSIVDLAGAWLPLWNEEDWEYDVRMAVLGAELVFCDEFVGDQREHGSARLSRDAWNDRKMTANRAEAHLAMTKHVIHSDLPLTAPEAQHFARELFLLARQAGALGLPDQSRSLFKAAREMSEPKRSKGLDFRAYEVVANVFGWKAAAWLATKLDRIRAA